LVRQDPEWHHVLCEYMMIHQTPYVRRQVRKLMLFICGTKENYRELRDLHTLDSHMKNVQEILDIKEAKENKAYNLHYVRAHHMFSRILNFLLVIVVFLRNLERNVFDQSNSYRRIPLISMRGK
jgi:hypothetical protein